MKDSLVEGSQVRALISACAARPNAKLTYCAGHEVTGCHRYGHGLAFWAFSEGPTREARLCGLAPVFFLRLRVAVLLRRRRHNVRLFLNGV
jgi:hypothetical protein